MILFAFRPEFCRRGWPYLLAMAVPWVLLAGQRRVRRLGAWASHRRHRSSFCRFFSDFRFRREVFFRALVDLSVKTFRPPDVRTIHESGFERRMAIVRRCRQHRRDVTSSRRTGRGAPGSLEGPPRDREAPCLDRPRPRSLQPGPEARLDRRGRHARVASTARGRCRRAVGDHTALESPTPSRATVRGHASGDLRASAGCGRRAPAV